MYFLVVIFHTRATSFPLSALVFMRQIEVSLVPRLSAQRAWVRGYIVVASYPGSFSSRKEPGNIGAMKPLTSATSSTAWYWSATPSIPIISCDCWITDRSWRISLCTDLLMRKNYGFTPNLDFNPLPTRFNFTAYKHTFREYAAHRGRREQVSMVSV